MKKAAFLLLTTILIIQVDSYPVFHLSPKPFDKSSTAGLPAKIKYKKDKAKLKSFKPKAILTATIK